MSPPINLDGDTVDAITMDGDSVSEVTVDGDTVFSGIPDTGKERNIYDPRDLSGADGDAISSLPDQEGPDDLSGAATLRENGANGNQYLEFTTSESMDVEFGSNVSQPYEYFIVAQLRDLNDDYAFSDGATRANGYTATQTDDSYIIYAGGTGQTGGSADTDLHILNSRFDETNSDHALLEDDTAVIGPTGNAGSNDRDGHTISAFGDGARNSPLDFYFFVFFDDKLKGSERDDWYSYLSGEFA